MTEDTLRKLFDEAGASFDDFLSRAGEDLATIVARDGGIITCGNHLAVLVGTDHRLCPPGWTFVDLSTATPEKVREAVEITKRGRSVWPERIS